MKSSKLAFNMSNADRRTYSNIRDSGFAAVTNNRVVLIKVSCELLVVLREWVMSGIERGRF